VASWNDTAHPHDPERTVAALVAEQVARTPHAPAVEHHGRALTYAELWDRAGTLADALVARGVGSDVAVAIALERSIGMAVAVLGVFRAGGACVPLDPTYPAARRAQTMEISGARLVLAALGATPVVEGVEVVAVDTEGRVAATEPAAAPTAAAGTGQDLAYVIATSGSTGTPKGVALPQRALTNLVEWQLRRCPPGARTLQFSSLGFDVSFQEILTTWASGGTLVLVDDAVRRDAQRLLDHLIEHRVERLFLPFVALHALAQAAVQRGRFPTALREVCTAGEQLRVDDALRRFFAALPEARLENQYGPSETHVVTALALPADPATWPALPSIGAPIANTTVHVLDAAGRARPIGVPGELFLGGVGLARGYLGRPDLTAERFVEAPAGSGASGRLYRTGDRARWRTDGALDFLGRTDHQVKLRGFRVEPGEVAAVLSDAPGVGRCAVVVRDVPGAGARLVAYLTGAGPEPISPAAVRAFARERLPEHMVPSHVMVLAGFPLTPSGKVDAGSLPEPVFDRAVLATPHVAPRTDVEADLVAIWQDLLGIPDVGVDDDFFDLGGDSLVVVALVGRIRQRFGTDLPLGALAAAPTVAGLARFVERGTDTARFRPLVTLQAGDPQAKRPLFFVHGGSGNIAGFPRLARALPADQPVHALQWDGLDGSRGSRTVEAMARRYLAEIRSVQPTGPYLLGGQCVGGLVAREVARVVVAQGDAVDLLVMVDSPNLASPHFHVDEAPSLERWLTGRRARVLLSQALAVRRFLARPRRAQAAEVRLRARVLARRPVPPGDRERHGVMAMVAAVWRHRIRPVDVPTTYLTSGEGDAAAIGLTGSWDDGLLGWSEHVSPSFTAHRIPDSHVDAMYHPDAVAVLTAALDRAQRCDRRVAAGHAG
jgi:amino acid adenylation domain-containing protein